MSPPSYLNITSSSQIFQERRRVLTRRLRRKLPRAKILLGLWTLNQADSERRKALEETGVDLVVTSLGQAVEQIVAEAREAGGALDQAPIPPSTIEAASAAE